VYSKDTGFFIHWQVCKFARKKLHLPLNQNENCSEMNFFQRRRILKNTNALDLTPITKIDYEQTSENTIALIVPKFKNKILEATFSRMIKSKVWKIKLDELGSAVWLKIDGKSSVNKICSSLENDLGDKIKPVEERVSKFISLLYREDYITFYEIE